MTIALTRIQSSCWVCNPDAKPKAGALCSPHLRAIAATAAAEAQPGYRASTTPSVLIPQNHRSQAGTSDDAWLTDDDRDWLAADDRKQTRVGRLLHTEVQHDGACYWVRSLVAVLVAAPAGLVGEVIYAGPYERYVHPVVSVPLLSAAAAIALTVLVVAGAVCEHALWHRAVAPWATYIVLGDEAAVLVEAVSDEQ